MLRNYLTESGTLTCIQGNDAYAPSPYWTSHAYRPLTTNELDALKNNSYDTTAFTLASGQYTCLEVTVSGSIFLGAIRCYFKDNTPNTLSVGLVIEQPSSGTVSHQVNYSELSSLEVEDIKGPIAYWKQIDGVRGYFESSPIPLITSTPVTLISADYYSTSPVSLSESQPLTNKSIRQIFPQPSGLPRVDHIKLTFSGSPDGPTSISHVSIAPIDITVSSTNFEHDLVQDHSVRGKIRHWVSDVGRRGHFEGDNIWLDVGQAISGTWITNTVWSGSGSSDVITKEGYTIRQLIPGTAVTQDADGIRITLQSDSEDISIRNVSYMPATSTIVTLDFQTNSTFEQRNIKGSIVRWKNDGLETGLHLQNVTFDEANVSDYVDIQKSRHYGHFEGPEIDFDDGQSAIMYDANVIGFRCTNNGLVPGDYIAVYGTEYYDGHYIVLTYSTAHIIVVWGIYDPEVFTATAKVRKIVSLGPEIDVYGQKQNVRDVVPYVQINFINGHTAHIIDYVDYGKSYASVELSTIEENTEVTSIYDVFYDAAGYLSSGPGPSATPEYETSMPNFSSATRIIKSRSNILRFIDSSYEFDDPGRAYIQMLPEQWSGNFETICEPQDPEYEGDWTGWKGMERFFDRHMAQPWPCLIAAGCPWVTLCYRGPMPVKFIIDLGSPKVFSKYRMWIQLMLCPQSSSDFCVPPPVSKPKSWKLQATTTPDVESSWVTLENVVDYNPDLFVAESYPPDKQIPGTCGVGDWLNYPTLELYQYYRLYVYEVWVKAIVYGGAYCTTPVATETTHICEFDFCEHRTALGLFPSVVTSNLFFDVVQKISPNEHMRGDSMAYYTLSFDDGKAWYIYEQNHWKAIAKEDLGVWKYYREYWRVADENNSRKALWHAFSAGSNRMTTDQMQNIPPADYSLLMVSGCYPQIGVGLVSNGIMESLLSGITIQGIVYNPIGTAPPEEVLFGGEQSFTISGGGNILSSDWLNTPILSNSDILLTFDIDSSSGVIPRWTDYSDYRYFERAKYTSCDRQSIVVDDFVSQSGVVLIRDIEIRNSDLVIFPATDNGLGSGDWVTITGLQYYNKLYNVRGASTDTFSVVEKHYPETVVSGAFARQLISVNSSTSNEPDVQVGSIIEFSSPADYSISKTRETTLSGLYWVTENKCQPSKEATHAFDSNSAVEFHSGCPINKGSVIIGLKLIEPRLFDSLHVQASENYYYWDKEFPKDIIVSASNLTSPVLEQDGDWVTLSSGVCSLPIAPGKNSESFPLAASGIFSNYRLQINSIYSDADWCVRFGKLQFFDGLVSHQGFTILEAKQGFDAKYLFDGTTYSQYVSKYPMASGVVNIGIDYWNKPVKATQFRLTSAKDSVTAGNDIYPPWKSVAPKTVSFWTSLLQNPRLDVDVDWIRVIKKDYDKPGGELSGGQGVTGPWIIVPYSPKGAMRHTEGYTTAGTYWNSDTLMVEASFYLDNDQVIDKVGIYSLSASNGTFKLCKNINDLTWDISTIQTFSHPGGGFVWFTLDAPIKIPSTGNYSVGLWANWYAVTDHFIKTGQSGKNFRTYSYDTDPVGEKTLNYYYTDRTLQVAVQYMSFNDFPSSSQHYRLKVESVWGGPTYHLEMSGMEIETTEGYENSTTVTYSGEVYPKKLLDLPANYQVTGVTITSVSGLSGGYTEVDGNPDTASGTFVNSFWTIVDRHWQLDNGKALAYVGVDSDLSSNISFRIFKDRNMGGEWYDIWDVATFTHSGGGFQWFKLTNPYAIPSDGGTYHLGWYQPNNPRYMGDSTGLNLVSYQYGNYTGTNINLPLHSNQRPHLAVRYATSFTVGTEGDNDCIYPLFSPSVGGEQYVSDVSFGPFTTASAIYLYRPIPPISPDTQGLIDFTFYYSDPNGDNYDAWQYTVSGSDGYQSSHSIQHLADNDPTTFFYSHRKLDETQHLYFVFRFDNDAYINAYRLQASASYNSNLEQFPSMITIGGSNEFLGILSSEGWEQLYLDDGFLPPSSPGSLLPWVYFDDYSESYHYFRFDLCHSNYASAYSSLGEVYLRARETYSETCLVDEVYNVVKGIVGSGIEPSSVEMLYHPGIQRPIRDVFNTFTHQGISEPAPSSYFYRGENNVSNVCPVPERLFKDIPDNPEEIPFTVAELGNTNILAWHTLSEVTGDYEDLSGNSIIAKRIGPVLSCDGKYGRGAYISDDNAEEERNVRFTLPSRLKEYTVAFWFKPSHTLDTTYNIYYDILGGWTSYGAIPGIWNVSYSQDLLFYDSPYPYLQSNTPYYQSRLVFGNYGKTISTGRYRWIHQTWHHIIFAFKSDGSMKVWIDGAPDAFSKMTYSNVYPSDSCIVVSPDDIHYSERDYDNCMYFGLPLKGSDGVKGEFALNHVMHFNKYFTDEDAFNIYRFRYPNAEQDGIYFARTTTLQVPGRTIIDFGRDVCITKCAMKASHNTPVPGPETKWRLTALDSLGTWKPLLEVYDYIAPPEASLLTRKEEIIEVSVSGGVFPKKVFTLQDTVEDLTIRLEVLEAFKGGWYSKYPTLSTPPTANENFTFQGGYTTMFCGLFTGVPGGTFISQIGFYSNTAASGIKFKVGRHWAMDNHDVVNVCSGVTHNGLGEYWHVLPEPFLVPASGGYWDVGLYVSNPFIATGFFSYSVGYQSFRHCQHAYKSGDLSGSNILGWTYQDGYGNLYTINPRIGTRLCPTYSVGELAGSPLISSQLASSGIITSWSGSNSFSDGATLYLYDNAVVSDTSGKVRITITYNERQKTVPLPWYYFYNPEAYQYYGIEIDGLTTCATGIDISSIHFSEVPLISAVSGNYTTVISGIDTTNKYIPFIEKFMSEEGHVSVSFSRDEQLTWTTVSASDIGNLTHGDMGAVGSGNLVIAHTFHSSPSVSGLRIYPYQIGITDWSLKQSPTTITFSGSEPLSIGSGELLDSDYVLYTSSGRQWDMVILDVSNGYSSFTSTSPNGYILSDGQTYNSLYTNGEYVPSELNFISKVEGRYGDVFSVQVADTSTLYMDDVVDIYEPTYSGNYSVVTISGDDIYLRGTLSSETLSGGSYIRKIIVPEQTVRGTTVVDSYSNSRVVETLSGNEVSLNSPSGVSEVSAVYGLTSRSGGVSLVYTQELSNVIEGEPVKIHELSMTSNYSPPYTLYTDYDGVEYLEFSITANTIFPYKMFTLPSGNAVESISVDIIDPAQDAFEFQGDISRGDLSDEGFSGLSSTGFWDESLVLFPQKELMRIGFYTTISANLVFSLWEDCFVSSHFPVSYISIPASGIHGGGGAVYFDLPQPFLVPSGHLSHRIGVGARSFVRLTNCMHTSIGSSVNYNDSRYFVDRDAPTFSFAEEYLRSYGVASNRTLAIQANYRARFSIGYDDTHQSFFVPEFTAASGTSVSSCGPFGPYTVLRDFNFYFHGDTMRAVNFKVTVKKTKDVYLVLDGHTDASILLSDVVIDLGDTERFNRYRLLAGETCSGWMWDLYGTNQLPNWSIVSSGSQASSILDGEWTGLLNLSPDYRYHAFKFANDVQLRELQFLNTVSLSSGIACVATSSGSEWQYNYVGRISNVEVQSTEPENTTLYHAVTFDGGVTYKIFDEDYWRSVVRLNSGQWEYYNTSWMSAPQNTKFSAMRNSIDSGNIFTSVSLEQVEESEWHGVGSATNSGTLGFIQYFQSDGPYAPILYGYNINYITRSGGNDASWLISLIPSGYGYSEVSQSNIKFVDVPFRIDSGYEYIYGRVETDYLRVYLSNSSTSGIQISEVALLDTQIPDHPFYTEPFTYPTHLYPIVSSGVQIPELHDEHVRTGGIIIPERQCIDYQIQNIPNSLSIYYGELRAYFTKELGVPKLVSVAPSSSLLSGNLSSPSFLTVSASGVKFGSGYDLHNDYYSVYFWAETPLSQIAIRIGNSNTTGSGLVRLNELAIFNADSTYGWDIPDEFNHLESADTTNCSIVPSGLLGQQQNLSTAHMERLFDTSISGALPILPSYYIGLEAILRHFGGKSKEIRLYSDSYLNLSTQLFTQVSGYSSWQSNSFTWSGAGYFYSDLDAKTITSVRVYCSNVATSSGYDSMRWLRSFQLINYGDEIGFGTTGSGENIVELPTTYARYDQVKIYNNNKSGTYANARVLPRFSNNYHLDRVALISEDTSTWSHLDTGTNLPEDYDFDIGKFINTEVSVDGCIQLTPTSTSGHWISPVIEVLDPSSTAGYVYCKNLSYDGSYVAKDYQSVMNVVEVRSSHTKPAHSFLVTAVDTSALDGLQYPWKMVAFDSTGDKSLWGYYSNSFMERGSLTEPKVSPRRNWAYNSRYPLWQFYGFMDSRRYGAVTLGQEYGGFFEIPEGGYRAFPEWEDWYRAYFMWPPNVDVPPTDPMSPQNLHIYPRTNGFLFPIFNKALRYTTRTEGGVDKGAFHFVDTIFRGQPFYERFQEYYYSDLFFHLRNIYSFNGGASTPESSSEIDYLYSFPGTQEALASDSIRLGSCIDNHSDSFSYWVHYAHEYESENYYKTLLITNERVEQEFTNIELKFNYLVEGSHSASRGFWGLADRAVYWLEYDGGALSVRFSVSADSLGKEFKLITFGNIDNNNNLWFVDLATERVIRINFYNLEHGISSVDYTRAIDGAVSVYPDPYDGSAYVYIIRDPEFPNNDCVKIVHVGDYDYIVPETVCAVPGISIVESYNVNLYGRSTNPQGYYDILPNDLIWKEGGAAQWERYSAGSPTLPKGHYKQFKVTLRRNGTESVSPQVEYIRIPKPALLNKIPWKGYRDVFIDTIPHQEETNLPSGDYTLDLLVWWPRE